MSKKILSVMLALVLVLSTLGTVAFAAGIAYEDDDSEYSQTWELGTPVDNEDGTWSVDVYLTTDYPTGAIQFVVEETDNNDVIELTNVIKGDALYYDAIITPDAESGKVLIVPAADPDNSMVDAKAIDGVIATLVYSYTGEGSAKIAIFEDPKYADYKEGTLMALRAVDANLASTNLMAGQLVNGVGDEQTIGTAAEPADLALTETGAADGVIIDKNKTFGGAYDGVVYGFKWSADNTFRSKAYLENSLTSTNGKAEDLVFKSSENKTSGLKWGTGSTVEVLNSAGTTEKVYLVIIFGDVNCDGFINNTDVTDLKSHVKRIELITDNTAIALAANTHYTTPGVAVTVNNNDLSQVKYHVKKTKRIDQAAAAAKHNSYTSNYT